MSTHGIVIRVGDPSLPIWALLSEMYGRSADTIITPTSVTVIVQGDCGSGWVDLTDDVLVDLPFTIDYGIAQSDPTNRVADTGKFAFCLDNSETNSLGRVGAYSPFNPSKRSGFDFNIPIRVVFTPSTTGIPYYKWRGRLSEISPTPGVYNDRRTACVAVDLWDDYANIDLPAIAPQQNVRDDALLALILDGLPATSQPAARSIETGVDEYAIALDGSATGSKPKVRDTINQICLSGFNYAYIKGDTVAGGRFAFENRHHRSGNPTVLATLDETLILNDGLVVPGSRSNAYSKVQVFVRPTKVDDSPTSILFSLQTAPMQIGPGEVVQLTGPYTDQTTREAIGGMATVDPIATTDYLFNAAQDGGGTDLTADLAVTVAPTGLNAAFELTNAGATGGFVTKLQLRGKAIVRYDAMIEVTIGGTYGDNPLAFEMPFQNDANVGTDVADFLANLLASPLANGLTVRFLANESDTLMDYAINREPGDRVRISESVSGLNTPFTINSVHLEVTETMQLWCTWGLESAALQSFWLWGIPGSSEWGETTVYGF